MQVTELAVFLLGATDEEEELSDLAADKRGLLDHQILGQGGKRGSRSFIPLASPQSSMDIYTHTRRQAGRQ